MTKTEDTSLAEGCALIAEGSLQWDGNRFDNIADDLFGFFRAIPSRPSCHFERHTVGEYDRYQFLNIVRDAIVTFSRERQGFCCSRERTGPSRADPKREKLASPRHRHNGQ